MMCFEKGMDINCEAMKNNILHEIRIIATNKGFKIIIDGGTTLERKNQAKILNNFNNAYIKISRMTDSIYPSMKAILTDLKWYDRIYIF